MNALAQVVKAYDVRGLVPQQLDAGLSRALGAAFAHVVDVAGRAGTSRGVAVVGHDMRPSSPELSEAFAQGVASQGVDVVRIGLCSTDGLYFASGTLDAPGAVVTASHNPAGYNGVKMCRAGARPVGRDSGLEQVRDLAQGYLDAGELPPPEGRAGSFSSRDILRDYAQHLRSLVDLSGLRRLTVVVDAGNGMAGHTVPAVLATAAGLAPLPLEVVPLYFELDGTFPHHEPNPLDPANLVDLQRAVRERGADLGLAFDGDADRCFVVDERGQPVTPSAVTALVAVREIARERARGGRPVVIHNVVTSMAVPEVVAEHGGTAVRTRVGHSYIKDEMARSGAVFGGEHSAHYYFRDFWNADTGMLAALHVLAALGESDVPLSQLVAGYERYTASGEINTTVADPGAAVRAVRAAHARRDGEQLDDLDGLTVTGSAPSGRWWFNLRASGTEPLLRLNVEAADRPTMEAVRDGVLAEVAAAPGAPSCAVDPSGIEPWVRAILRCPACSAELRDDRAPDGGTELVCTDSSCGLAYPVRDGIPVLLVDEARRPGS